MDGDGVHGGRLRLSEDVLVIVACLCVIMAAQAWRLRKRPVAESEEDAAASLAERLSPSI